MKNRTLHLFIYLFLFSIQTQSQVIAGGNNDFENDLTGLNTQRDWWDSSTNIVIDTSFPYSMSKAAKCNGHFTLYNQLYTDITGLTVGDDYKLDFYSKGGEADLYIGSTSDVYTGTYFYISEQTSYSLRSLSFTATHSTMRLWIDFYPNTSVHYVDNFSVENTTLSTNNPAFSSKSIRVYPNPSSDYVFLHGLELNKLKIYDILGKNCSDLTSVIEINHGFFKVNISNLNSGLYFFSTPSKTVKVFKK